MNKNKIKKGFGMEINRQRAARILAANLKAIEELKKRKSSKELFHPIKEVYNFAKRYQLQIDFNPNGIQR